MFRSILFVWGLAMTIVMIVGFFALVGPGIGRYSDSATIFWALVFWAAVVLGLPGWIGVAALTFAQRERLERNTIGLLNAPAFVAGVLVLGILGKMTG